MRRGTKILMRCDREGMVEFTGHMLRVDDALRVERYFEDRPSRKARIARLEVQRREHAAFLAQLGIAPPPSPAIVLETSRPPQGFFTAGARRRRGRRGRPLKVKP